MEKVIVYQGKWKGNDYVQPLFPINDENVKKMLKSGVAEKTESSHANWGSGIYEKHENKWVCISSDYDSSG
jgi:hypothetical protein